MGATMVEVVCVCDRKTTAPEGGKFRCSECGREYSVDVVDGDHPVVEWTQFLPRKGLTRHGKPKSASLIRPEEPAAPAPVLESVPPPEPEPEPIPDPATTTNGFDF